MAGGSVPYHLRQNKAIERNLFIELLLKSSRLLPISKYTYISFGGPFLEDFKLMHSTFGNTGMVSIEIDKEVLKRQKFNAPFDSSVVDCKLSSSDEFVANFNVKNNVIVWLDYASARQVGDQVREFGFLLSKLGNYDFLKVTLNANPETLAAPRQQSQMRNRVVREDVFRERFDELRRRLGDNMPGDVSIFDMGMKLPVVLLKALRDASAEAMRGRTTETFVPLTSYVYSDSNQRMFTFTGIVLPRAEADSFLRNTEIDRWKLATKSWERFEEIQVPELSIKERSFLDSHMPSFSAYALKYRLGHLVDDDEEKSLSKIESYLKYYRFFPQFSKIYI